jgi:transcriptional regulator with XRE-family HTH domain
MVDRRKTPPKPFPQAVPAVSDVASFAEWVRKLTARGTGVSQRTLASVAGVSFQAVNNWSKGISQPEAHKLLRICEWAGLDYDQMHRLVHAKKLRLAALESYSAPADVTSAMVSTSLADSLERLTPAARKILEDIAKTLPRKGEK